jgi:hemerythrin HHE cation binding domain-containing protein
LNLLEIQRSLRNRFDEFRLAAQRQNATAAEIALADFENHLTRWTEAEEQALIPALERAKIPGRDVRRELRLEYVQIRELTRFVLRQIVDHIRLDDLTGYIENLDRRLRAHETEMENVYNPAAEAMLTAQERAILEGAKPNDL